MMDGIVPTMSVNGNGGSGGWGDALGAFAGALVGSWFTNGNGGNGGRGGSSGGSGPIIVNGGGSDCGSSAELDALSGIQASINGVGLSVIQGQNAANLAACQGFGGVVASNDRNTAQLQNSMNQGFNGIYNAITNGNAANQQTLCQGFNGVQQAISECCCKTQTAIHAEGEATRALVNQIDRERLLREMGAKDAKIAALESQAFISASQTAQNAAFQQAINQQSAQFARVLGAYRLGRIDERDGTAADGGAAA